MKKILYITDAVKLNIQRLDFACFLCNLTDSKLTGIFLENREHEARSPAFIRELAISGETSGTTEQLKETLGREHIREFRNACELRGVNCVIHRDAGAPLREVISESRYADMLVIDSSTSFTESRECPPTKFVEEVLASAECPVVLPPDSFDGIDEIIFTYDGSPSSIFAIKQFTYLFPEMEDRKAIIFDVVPPGKKIGKSQHMLQEWLNTHYGRNEILIREDERTRAQILEYLLGRKNAFVVMGAFGRGLISAMLSPSHADPVVKIISLPIFITHR